MLKRFTRSRIAELRCGLLGAAAALFGHGLPGDASDCRAAQVAAASEADSAAGVVAKIVASGGTVICRVEGAIQVVDKSGTLPQGDAKVISVTLPGQKYGDDDLQRLKPLVDLEKVICLGAPITDAGLAHLVGFEQLRLVTVADSKVTDAGLEHLAKLKKLDTLGLSGTKITDAGLKSLAACSALATINLTGTAIGDQGIANLGKLEHLRDIRLGKTQVTDACIASLRRCEALMMIDFQGCAITDAAMPELGKFPNLKNVGFHQTKITMTGIAALQESFKKTRLAAGPPQQPLAGPPRAGQPMIRRPLTPRPAAGPPEKIKIVTDSFVRRRPIAQVFEAPVPTFLEGAIVFGEDGPAGGTGPRDGVVDVEVVEATALYVAVSFKTTTADPPGVKPVSYDRMLRDGWLDVGRIYTSQMFDAERKLFWKTFNAGDKVTLRTGVFLRPLVILPANADSNPTELVPNETMSAAEARSVVRSKVARLLRAKQFDELEKLAARARDAKKYDADAEPLLKTFYDGLDLDGETDAEWADDLKLFEAWLAAKPNSIAAHYALVRYWTSFAWYQRGKFRLAGQVIPPEGYREFNDHIFTARKWLTKASKLRERDSHFFFYAVESAVLRQEKPEAVDEALTELLKFDPDYLPPLAEATRYYLPRWFGAAGDMEKLAAKYATLTKEPHGDSVYALVAMRGADFDGVEVLKQHGFDWPRVKQGFADLRKRFPKSVKHDAWNVKFAFFMEDRAETQAAFARLDTFSKREFTYDREMETWRRWASADYLTGDQLAVYETLKHPAIRLEWTVDDRHWVVFDEQADLAVFDAADGKLLSRTATHSGIAPRYASVVPFSKKVVAVTADGKVNAYKIPGGEARELGLHEGGVRGAALSSDGSEYATLGADGKLKFWELDTEEESPPYDWDLSPLRISALEYIPNSRSLAVGDTDHRVGFWNRDTMKKSVDLAPRNAPIRSLRVSPDGTMLAVLAGHELTLWRLKEWELAVTIPINEYILGDELVFSRDGKSLAGAATIRKVFDGRKALGGPAAARVILVWNTADGTLRHTLAGHKSYIRALAFNSDGTRLVSGSNDMTIRVWKTD